MDMNQMTRVVGGQRIPCVVIDTVTGERLRRHAVDAKEMIGDGKGRYQWALDVAAVKVPEVKVDANGAPIALVEVPLPPFTPTPEELAAAGQVAPVAPVAQVTPVGATDGSAGEPAAAAGKKGGRKGGK